MTRDEFEVLAQTWGGDLTRWPAHLRAAAAAFALMPEATEILAQAQQIDRLIVESRPKISAQRVDHLVWKVVAQTSFDKQSHARPALWWRRWLIPAASLAGAALIGASIGVLAPLSAFRETPGNGTILSMILDSAPLAPDWVLQ
jgi:hypothetical protein